MQGNGEKVSTETNINCVNFYTCVTHEEMGLFMRHALSHFHQFTAYYAQTCHTKEKNNYYISMVQ